MKSNRVVKENETLRGAAAAGALLLFIVLQVGCGAGHDPLEPVPSSMEPAFRVEDTQTEVIIHGAGFAPRITVGPEGEQDLDARFTARLEIGDGDEVIAVDLLGVQYVDATRLRGVIPEGLPAGKSSLVVISPEGSAGRLEDGFENRLTPVVQSINPDQGPRSGGGAVTIRGLHFVEGSVATIGGRPLAEQSLVDSTQLSGIVPGVDETGPADVCVTSPYVPDSGPAQCLEGAFQYGESPLAPVLDSVEPAFGPLAGGNEIILRGRNFTSSTRAQVGDDDAHGFSATGGGTEARVFAPSAQETGPVDVRVSNEFGAHFLRMAYTYEGVPVIDSVSPDIGRAAGGEEVVITGQWLVEGTVVEFDGRPLLDPRYSGNDTVITGYSPRGRGSVSVRAYGRGKLSETQGINGRFVLANGFTYRAPPRLTSVSPSLGPQIPPGSGYQVDITGEGFVPGMEVTVGPSRVSGLSVASDGRSATFNLPPGRGSASVTVTTPDGVATLVDAFTYRPPLVVTNIQPRRGWGGEEMAITGGGLSRCDQVSIGGQTLGDLRVDGDDRLLGTVPPSIPGPASIRVECGMDGFVVVEGAFTYRKPREPLLVDRVVPLEGPVGGGNDMWIFGQGLGNDVTVTVGGEPLQDVEWFGERSLRGKVPPGERGLAQVVINRLDTSKAWSEYYTYTESDVLDVSAVKPSSGPVAGGTVIRLEGSGFREGMQVTIGGQGLQDFVVLDRHQARGVVPAAVAPGDATLLVSDANGACQSCMEPPGLVYTYVDPADLAFGSIYPERGPAQGNTLFIIEGSGFPGKDALAVRFGSQTATIIGEVEDGRRIRGITPISPQGAGQVVEVTVELNDSRSVSMPEAFSYHEDSELVISSVDPPRGVAGEATDVVLRGGGFTRNTEGHLGGDPFANLAPIARPGRPWSTQVAGTTPALAPGYYDVSVKEGAQFSILPRGFCVEDMDLAVSSITPPSGSINGGTEVSILGVGLHDGTVVLLDGAPLLAPRSHASGTQITGRTPPGASGVADIKVQSGCRTINAPVSFTYTGDESDTETPVPSMILPAQGAVAGGTRVVIKGRNFAQPLAVSLGGQSMTSLVLVDSNTIVGVSPSAPAGPALDLVVARVGGAQGTLSQAFSYVSPPSVLDVEPPTGMSQGNQSVVITLSSVPPADTVATIGGALLDDISISGNKIFGQTPPGRGAADVRVTNRFGSGLLPGGFTYLPPPVITSVSPSFGPRTGETSVVITGSGFVPGSTGVRFGPSFIREPVVSGNQIVGRTPPGWGPVDVHVDTGAGSSRLEEGFNYLEPPTIIRVNPVLGKREGDTLMVIQGRNYSESVSFEVGGDTMQPPADGAGYYLGPGLGAGRTPPAATTGVVGVSVVESWGSTTRADSFRYVEEWTALDLSPVSDGPFHSVTSCLDGPAWVAVPEGLVRVDIRADDAVALHPLSEFHGLRIVHIDCFRPGVLALASDSGIGICSVHDGSPVSCRVVDDMDVPDVTDQMVVRRVAAFDGGRVAGATTRGMVGVLARGGLGAGTAWLVDTRNGLPASDLRGIVAQDSHIGWLATAGGVARYDFRNSQVRTFTTGNSAIPSDDTLAVAVADGGVLYVGLDIGVAMAEPPVGASNEPWIWQSVGGLPEGEGVHALAPDHRENVWAAMEGGGAARIREAQVVETLGESDGLPSGRINDIHTDYNGAVYFAGEGGVVRIAP